MAGLYIFSGLPGAGKSTLSKELAKQLGATYLRIDTIEQGLRDFCKMDVEGEGYELCYRVAADNLGLGLSVIADSCNPIELTRNEWEKVAAESGCTFFNIEIICSDQAEHRRRVESRPPGVPGLSPTAWQEVEGREFEPWSKARIVIDTAGKSATDCLGHLFEALRAGPYRAG